MSELLIALIAVAIPAILGTLALTWRLILSGLKNMMGDALLSPVKSELQEIRDKELKEIKDDTEHLRNNGHEVRVRLNQGAFEMEAVRGDIRTIHESLSDHVTRIRLLEVHETERTTREIKPAGPDQPS